MYLVNASLFTKKNITLLFIEEEEETGGFFPSSLLASKKKKKTFSFIFLEISIVIA